MIKNEYIIENGIVIFTITRRNGDIFKVKMDENQLYRIDKLNLKIHVSWHKEIDGYYAELCNYLGTINTKAQYETLLLHRLVTDATDKDYVDHIEAKETLDNTLANLRVSRNEENTKNRKSKNSNNTSGYRNVSLNKESNEWMVQLQIEGKNTCLKTFPFDQLEEAGKFAEDKRKEIYGKFAGKS